jgi:hypothetical protein
VIGARFLERQHARCAIDVSLHEVTAQPAVGRERTLEVDRAVAPQ